jgi:DNA anti-recombination protein RmuC
LLQIQTETDRRADVMLGRLVRHVHEVSEQTNKGGATTVASHATSEETIASLRNAMRDNMANLQAQLTELLKASIGEMQAESDKRAEAMLERSNQKPHEPSDRTERSAAPGATPHDIPGAGVNQKLHSHPAQKHSERGLTWANVTRTAKPTAAGWAAVANRKRRSKKKTPARPETNHVCEK